MIPNSSKLISFFFISLFLLSCSDQKNVESTNDKKNSNSVQGNSGTEEKPAETISKKLNVLDYLKIFPIENIQDLEEWGNKEKLELVEKGKSGEWKITKIDTASGFIDVVADEMGSMGFNFRIYQKKNGDMVVGLIQFSGQALYSVHFYNYHQESNEWTNADQLVPKLSLRMYLREDFNLDNYKEASEKAPDLYLSRDTVKTAISTFSLARDYELELDEDKDVKYDIDLPWNGERFVLNRKKKK